MGLNEKDDAIVRRGWTIVEKKNQGKIYNLVMDMLSFSKDREPALEAADLNETVTDVVELMQSRAGELNVTLDWQAGVDLPQVMIDPDGIHRAVLNIVTNAIDAAEGIESARVAVSTTHAASGEVVQINVTDNGVGISTKPTLPHLDLPGLRPRPRAPRGALGWACPSPRRSSASTAAGSSSLHSPVRARSSPSSCR